MTDTTKEVPLEPTEEMLLAAMSLHRKWENADGDFSGGYWQAIYKAMIEAAPSIAGKTHKELVERLKGWDSPHWAGVIPPELMDDLREAASALPQSSTLPQTTEQSGAGIVNELRRLGSAMEPDDTHEEVDPDSAMLNQAADYIDSLITALREADRRAEDLDKWNRELIESKDEEIAKRIAAESSLREANAEIAQQRSALKFLNEVIAERRNAAPGGTLQDHLAGGSVNRPTDSIRLELISAHGENHALRDALDHIMRVAREGIQPTRRLDWIEIRARYALEGKEWSRDIRETPRDSVRELVKENEKLRAALSASSHAGWIPIETAPKDGTTVLIPGTNGATPAAWAWSPNADRWAWCGVTMGIVLPFEQQPTHWMPPPPGSMPLETEEK